MWNQHVKKSLLLSKFSVIIWDVEVFEVCKFVKSDDVNLDVQIFLFRRGRVWSSCLGYYLTSARSW